MLKKHIYLIFIGLLVNLYSSLALAQLPNFEDLDTDNNGVIDQTEYDKFIEIQEENSNSAEEEVVVQKEEPSLGLSKYISLGSSFIDTANIISPSCTTFNECGADPAIFSYTVTGGEDVFNVNAAIAFKTTFLDQLDPNIDKIPKGAKRYVTRIVDPVIEANVSSADSANSNFVRVAVPLVFSFNDTATLTKTVREELEIPADRKPSFFQQHNLIVVPKYEADQGFDTQTIGLDLLYAPTIPDIGIGAALREGTFGFRWLPVVGFEFGNVIKNSQDVSTLPADTFARATARLRAEFGITNDLSLNADYVFYLDLTGDQDINDFVNVTFQYFLDDQKNISVGLEYTNGGRSPTFEDADFLRTFFGLRF
ncbi:MAG: hypothetical protein QNJ60_03715 [Xenococcaceae cyanobacterium MO_188.B19]|nr:hypothetical protein [Xenococcaceae cyanobacterium MO_188.B19]